MKRITIIILLALTIMSCQSRSGKRASQKKADVPHVEVSGNRYDLTYDMVSDNHIVLSNGFAIKSKVDELGDILYHLYVKDVYVRGIYIKHTSVTSVDDLIEKLVGEYNRTSRPFYFEKVKKKVAQVDN